MRKTDIDQHTVNLKMLMLINDGLQTKYQSCPPNNYQAYKLQYTFQYIT